MYTKPFREQSTHLACSTRYSSYMQPYLGLLRSTTPGPSCPTRHSRGRLCDLDSPDFDRHLNREGRYAGRVRDQGHSRPPALGRGVRQHRLQAFRQRRRQIRIELLSFCKQSEQWTAARAGCSVQVNNVRGRQCGAGRCCPSCLSRMEDGKHT